MAIYFIVTGKAISKDRIEELKRENEFSQSWYCLVILALAASGAASAFMISHVVFSSVFAGPVGKAWGWFILSLVIVALSGYEKRRLEEKKSNSNELKDLNTNQLAELAEIFRNYRLPKLDAMRAEVVAQGRGFCVGEYRGILRYAEEEENRQATIANKKAVYG